MIGIGAFPGDFPDMGPYEWYCFNEAVYMRAALEEREAQEAARERMDLSLDGQGGSVGDMSARVGRFDKDVLDLYLKSGGKID